MGHIARILEDAGISTVIIASQVFAARTEPMMPPRLVQTPFPMSRPLGAPNDVETQMAVLQAGLGLLESAENAGTILNPDLPYRPSK